MAITLRTEKGSPLTAQEMDDNLAELHSGSLLGLSVPGVISGSGLRIDNYIYHNGENPANTAIGFPDDDQIRLVTHGQGIFTISGSLNNQKVGIGTTTPEERFHIKGNTAVRLEVETGDATSPVVKVTNTEGSYGVRTLHGKFGIYDYNGATDRLIISGSEGNLGIGMDINSSPQTKLHVVGAISGSSLEVSGDITAPNIGAGVSDDVVILDSDGTFKTDTIDSRVWGSSLVDVSGTPTAGDIPYFSDSNTVATSGVKWNTGVTSLYVNGGFRINQQSDESTSGIQLFPNTPYGSSTTEWQIWNGGSSYSGQLQFSYENSVKGYIDYTAGGGSLNSTGQHRSYSDSISSSISLDSSSSIQDYVGLIVESDGTYRNIDTSTIPTINEALPNVVLSTTAKSKRVFGVISNQEDLSITESGSANLRTYKIGAFGTVIETEEEDNRLIINSFGEGAMWVCDVSGSIENGDYICSSGISGLGMKQDDDLLHNYTVAKITQDCNFDDPDDYIEFEYSGSTYRKEFVGVTYHCG